MSYARVLRRRLLFAAGVVAASMLALTGVARAAESFGEITRFAGPGSKLGDLTEPKLSPTKESFEWQPWQVIGVDPEHNEVFVLEETQESKEKHEESTRFFRLQELSSEKGSEGVVLGSHEFTVTTPNSGDGSEYETEEIDGIAIDPSAKRLYFLVTAERDEDLTDESEGAADRLYAFKTTPNAGKELEPAEGTNKGVLLDEEQLHTQGPNPGEALLQPHGITVDPYTHEVLIAAHVDDANKCEEEELEVGELELVCEPDELSSPTDHYVTQRVKENGELGEVVDTKNALKQTVPLDEEELELFAPSSPVVVGTEHKERTLALHPVFPVLGANLEHNLAEFPMATGGTFQQFALPDAGAEATGAETNEFEELREYPEGEAGGALAASPNGELLYGFTHVNNEEGAKREAFLAISERSAATLQPLGWSGGQRPGASDACVLAPGLFSGQHPQIAVGKEGDVFVLAPEYLHEPPAGTLPTKKAIVEFGPGGKGCPTASVAKIEVLLDGKEPAGPIDSGTPITLSSPIKQADALSVTWKIENEATKSVVGEERQNADQYQTPKLNYAFKEGGKFKVIEEIKTDNLDTPALTVSRSVEVVEVAEALHVTAQPSSVTIEAGETARFTAAAVSKPVGPSPQWYVSSGGGEFKKDGEDTGAKATTLEVLASEAKNQNRYYAEFSNGKETVKSETVTLTVTPAKAVEPPPTTTGSTPPPTTSTPTTTGEVVVLHSEVVAPRATLASASLLVSSSGAVSVKVSCPAGATTCIGTVQLRTATAVLAKAGQKKKSILTLATGSFSVSGGATKTITLHLSATARKLLAKTHEIRARSTVAAHDPAGEKASTTKLLTLRPAPVKHKH